MPNRGGWWTRLREFFHSPTHEEIVTTFERRGFSPRQADLAAHELRLACRQGRKTPQWIMDRLAEGEMQR